MSRAPRITIELERQLMDAILSIIWERERIERFFSEDCGLTESDLQGTDTSTMTRRKIVDKVFKNLRNNRKHKSFHDIYLSLKNWRDFDSYWFRQGKLDAQEARKNISKLKENYEEQNPQLVREPHLNHEKSNKRKDPNKKVFHNLEDLQREFYEICSLEDRQKRGYGFEKLINSLADREGLSTNNPFKIEGEQIDGSLEIDGAQYLIEVKWQKKKVGNESVYPFLGKINSKGMYPRGVFISLNGYTSELLNCIRYQQQNFILLEGSHIMAVLEGRVSFYGLIKNSVKRAQTKKEIKPDIESIVKDT